MFLHLCVILFTGGGGEGLCPSMHHRSHEQGWSLSREGLCPEEVSDWGGGSLCPGGSLSKGGGSLSKGGGSLLGSSPPDRHPPYGNERTVCILLECILVHFCWYSVSTFKIYEECYVLFSGAKVAQYSGINLHKQIVAEPAYGKILLSWIV